MYCVFSYCQYVNSSAILVRKNLSPQATNDKNCFLLWRNPKPKANFLDWIESREESFFQFQYSHLVFNLCFKLD